MREDIEFGRENIHNIKVQAADSAEYVRKMFSHNKQKFRGEQFANVDEACVDSEDEEDGVASPVPPMLRRSNRRRHRPGDFATDMSVRHQFGELGLGLSKDYSEKVEASHWDLRATGAAHERRNTLRCRYTSDVNESTVVS